MKKIATFFLILFYVIAYSQKNTSIILQWSNKSELIFNDVTIKTPVFAGDSYYYDFEKNVVLYTKKELVSNYVDENSLQLSNINFQTISVADLGQINVNEIPTSLNASIFNCISRDKIYASLQFYPIIKEGSNYKKVTSLEYSFKLSNNSNRILNNNVVGVTNSVLSVGNWYKFYIEKSGVYKIDKSFLSQLGINTNGLNPKKIKIYGSGGKMLPLVNSVSFPMDLEENAIQIIGEEDGVLDNNDKILFYGEGMDNWNAESNTNLNLYAERTYYYINVEGNDGKRIQPLFQPNSASSVTFTNYDEYQFHEIEKENIARVGRYWYGENFSIDDEQEFTFDFPNAVTNAVANVSLHFGGISFVDTNFTTTVNGQNLPQANLAKIVPNSGNLAADSTITGTINTATTYNFNIKYNNNGVPTSKGYLDYIRVTCPSNLTGTGKQYRFQKNEATQAIGIGEYQFNNATTINEIWDITDIYNVANLLNDNQNTFSFKASLGSEKKYLVVNNSDYFIPKKDSKSKVINQNLKGTVFLDAQANFKDVDYLIITPKFLNLQAEKLANFHRNYSNLNVKVINLENIYEEFSSGKQDIGAIRNFVKYVYENASTPSKKVKYVNLFGDASYDFNDRIPNNTNIVPIYHALNSNTTLSTSFASDDFFCYMDANEGNIFPGSPYAADIAVGRMLVSSNQQAEEMVQKVIDYYDIKSYGSWRNNLVTISDDADDNTLDLTLQDNQNFLTNEMYLQNPIINFKKIFLDAYVQETSAGGNRYPKAKEEVTNSFEKGALLFNYLGHGSEDGLTGERIWDKQDGINFNNRYRYPVFITITCDFSKFDNPYRPSAGEYTYWNPKGGAIAMISTTRSIGYAFTFNNNLTENLYNYTLTNNLSIAEILRLSKMQSNNDSNTKVALYIGDPALILAIPRQKVVLTKVNDVPISQPIDDFKALAYVKISGEVRDENDAVLTNYNGELSVNIFDKNYNKTTFNNDNFSPPITFTNLGETIFRGNASVNNGQFEFGFVVPKDIKIPVDNGRISFYTKRNQTLLDKTGLNVDIKIGGIDTNAVADTTPPKVMLYMNDETFVNGGITNESPFFLAFLEDEHGINTASGIGHDLVAILDGDESNPYTLNDYYETELDNYTKGKIRFPFRNLSLGLHTITLKAWDVYNNFITADIQFVVVGDETVTLKNVLNYPNPFVNYTQFWFTHNRPFEPLDVQVQIFTITGKIVKTINQNVNTEGFLSREIIWDGKDDFGDRIGKGVYVYKLTVKSTLTGEKSDKIEKLVIL